MTVRVYRDTDGSAPVLTGQTGSLVALLDAILVNGYGSQTAAGWTKAFSTTNKAAYKQNLTGANNASGMYLYVDDTGPGAGAAKEARVSGFEVMSAITPTGTGQFPTAAQSAIGVGCLVVRKSATADATARKWTCVANGQTIYLFIESGDTTVPLACTTFCYGDFKSYKPADQYAVMIIGRAVENSGSSQMDPMQSVQIGNTNTAFHALNSSSFGHFAARSWTGVGGSVKIGKPMDLSRINGNCMNSVMFGPYTDETKLSVFVGNALNICFGRNTTPYVWPAPNSADGALALQPVYLCHNFAMRGYLAGLWMPLHDRPCGHNDSFTVTGGNLNGKTLLAQNIQAYINSIANADYGTCIVETSDTWS